MARQVVSVVGAGALAITTLSGGTVQAAATVPPGDQPGEIVVQAVSTRSIDAVLQRLSRFGATASIRMTDSDSRQALIHTNALQATIAEIKLDMADPPAKRTVEWYEANVSADDPRAQDGDSGSDPYCPPPPAPEQTQASAQDGDSGSDGARRCTRVLLPTAPLLMPRLYAPELQYAVDRILLDEAQDAAKKPSLLGSLLPKTDPVKVAVLDTQVDATHLRFLLHITGELNLLTKSLLTPLLEQGHARGHGTFVAGVIRQAAPDAVIMPVRVLNNQGRGSTAQVAEGIRWAVKNGADVINMSLHTPTNTRVLEDAVKYAISKGVVVVAAYGNEGKYLPAAYPADYPGVISVMATDQADTRATFSNYGRPGVVAAPGVNIVSTYPLQSYAVGSGTSYAAPWVAGEAALIKSIKPSATPAEVLRIIQRSANDVSAANGGAPTTRVNAYNAIKGQFLR